MEAKLAILDAFFGEKLSESQVIAARAPDSCALERDPIALDGR